MIRTIKLKKYLSQALLQVLDYVKYILSTEI